ncbi:MAG: DUF368 domain-containing protein [Halobacteriovoraceae bacterium]|nr:DUF368 domain-containing protein [Halobacteriovoraceae bacterium]MCB9095570.1 DUF368 domain-containing protein [Halobacteriovoraceae bacterium]
MKFQHFLYGLCMGTADIIPGISGGTMALILNIYHRLLAAISNIRFQDLLRLKFLSFFDSIDYKFLMPLGLGIVSAFALLSHTLSYLLKEYPIEIWSCFFGIILVSTIFLIIRLKYFSLKDFVIIALGIGVAYLVVTLPAVNLTRNYGMIYLSGAIASMAMILPGISGSFILVILGMYQYILTCLKYLFLDNNLWIIVTFTLGVFTGLLSMSKLLNWLLARYQNLILPFLLGFVLGALRKVWPWKEILSVKYVNDKLIVTQDTIYFPGVNSESIVAFSIMLAAGVLIALFEKSQYSKSVN